MKILRTPGTKVMMKATKAKEAEGAATGKAVERKKKKRNINEIMAEKEAKQREEMELKRKEQELANELNTPEGKLAEKLRLQRLEEERELELAKDMMGVADASPPSCGINFNPTTKEEFTELRTTLIDKLREAESSEHYHDFGVELINSIAKKGKPVKATIKMETDRSMFGRGLDDGYNDMD